MKHVPFIGIAVAIIGYSEAPATPSNNYQVCIRAKAAEQGTRFTITASQADQVVRRCEKLIGPLVAKRVAVKGPITNLPAGMETPDVRRSVAKDDIEYAAKMAISASVLPRPIP